MNKKLEAVVTDLDGSLLNDEKEIGEKDRKTVKILVEKGVKVFIATGRHFAATRYYSRTLDTPYPCLCCNGGLIYDFRNEKIISAVTFNSQDAAFLGKYALENDMTFYTYSKKSINLSSDQLDNYYFQGLNNPKYIVNNTELNFCDKNEIALADGIITFAFSDCTDEKYSKLLECEIVRKGEYHLEHSGRNFVDFNAKDANKGFAVKKISKDYDFRIENTLCMGDNYNDITMLETAGISIVPLSADERIQKHADFITSSCNDNPLTHAIETLFPELLK